MKKYNIGIVGATGLVGGTFLEVLAERKLPINELRLLASEKSAGKEIDFEGKRVVVEKLNENSFIGLDIALFSAGASISKIYAPIAVSSGVLVIDNSSAFRQEINIPLVVPEVNSFDIKSTGIISNPNCSTIQSVVPLKALMEKFGVERVVYTTYQSVSGSGMKGINDLKATLAGESPSFYPYPIALTCIPQIDSFLENGYTKEEMKMVNETRKMLHLPNLKVSATCVRVPVFNSHAVVIEVSLTKKFELEEIRETFSNFPSIKLVDEPEKSIYPVSTISKGNDYVYVGRIRRDISVDNGIVFYCVSDNIRKGAATNAVQIAEYVIKNKLL